MIKIEEAVAREIHADKEIQNMRNEIFQLTNENIPYNIFDYGSVQEYKEKLKKKLEEIKKR